MPWKLGDPGEATEKLEVRMPASMKRWLQKRRGGASRYIRKLVSAKMEKRAEKPTEDERPTDEKLHVEHSLSR